jgi:hypothetical protein
MDNETGRRAAFALAAVACCVQLAGSGRRPVASLPAHSGALTGELKQGIPFYGVRFYEHTLPFYIRRTVTLVDYRDEFDFGLTQEPGLAIATLAEFESRWRSDPEALAIMGLDMYDSLNRSGLPMRLLTRDTRRVIVAKP